MTFTRYVRATLLTLSAGLGALALTACSSPSAGPAPVSSTPATSSASNVATPLTSPGSTASAPAVVATTSASISASPTASERRAAAEVAWKEGAEATSAELNQYLQHAAADLSAAKALGVADPAAYAAAITDLRQIAAVPETNTTSAQRATVRTDTVALNRFFATPGL